MNALFTGSRQRRRGLVGLISLLLLAGCATPKIDWTGRIGSYTFDQAVMELGPPDKRETLKSGTIVAEWLTSRGYAYSYPAFGYGVNPYPYWYPGPGYPIYAPSPDYFLRLIFGPDGRLESWKKFAR